MDLPLRRAVRERAGEQCEYCRIHQDHNPFYRFQIDHIIAQQHGGLTELDNLALCCFRCNIHKGPNLAGVDPLTSQIVRLFHPRRDEWAQHMKWNRALLVGSTPVGRATLRVLAINHPDAVSLRESLMAAGLFPGR